MSAHSHSAAETIRTTIQRVIERVNTLSAGGPGWTRPSYSDLESAAHAMIEEEAIALGLTVTRDAAGNLFARMRGADPQAEPLYVGSHLDTVAEGGAYDGQAGVAGALALAAALRAEGRVPPADLVVVVTRAEESVWFPVSYAGSRAAGGARRRSEEPRGWVEWRSRWSADQEKTQPSVTSASAGFEKKNGGSRAGSPPISRVCSA